MKLFVAILFLNTFCVIFAADRKWQAITPGGNTICSKGGSFSFFYRPGAEGNNNLVIEYEGGGACWDDFSCSIGSFKSTVNVKEELETLSQAGNGIHDQNDERNAFKDFNHLFIPYCSADAHGGNKTTKYNDFITLHHRGRVNSLTALNWVFKKMPDPSVVGIVGCSAGSLGAIVNAPYVMSHYTNAKDMFYFGDSYVGVLSKPQFIDGFNNWDLEFSNSVPALSKANLEKICNDTTITNPGINIFRATATQFDQFRFASYTSNDDVVQRSFYKLGGGAGLWTTNMRSLVTTLHKDVKLYGSYIAAGSHHCRSQSPDYYTVTSGKNNVKLYEWVKQVSTDTVENDAVDCEPNC